MTTTSLGDNVEEPELSYAAGENVNSFAVPEQVKI